MGEEAEMADVFEVLSHDHYRKKLADGKAVAPIRPHPSTPPSPGLLLSAAPFVAAADKIRDGVTGRGQR